MRQVHAKKQVAHLWANQSQPSARNSSSSMYFDGPTIYSYGAHFPMAKFVEHKGKRCVLMTTQSYSPTTSGHMSIVRSALGYPPSVPVFHVKHPTNKITADTLKEYAASIEQAAKMIMRSRNKGEWLMEQLVKEVEEANAFAAFFGFRQRFHVPDDDEIKAKVEKDKKNAKVEQERQRKAREALASEMQNQLDEWKLGIRMSVDVTHRHYCDVALRVKPRDPTVMETSLGAEVPMAHAKRAYWAVLKVIKDQEPFVANGHTIKVGEFQINRIDVDGTVHAGCHHIKLSEIERFAKLMGWGKQPLSGPLHYSVMRKD